VIGIKATTFTLEDILTKFDRHEVISALQCAGNRQEDYVTEFRPLYVAPHWREGAIGNARWAGVRVRDVLAAAGMPVDDIALGKRRPGGKIVNFIGMDVDETGTPYGGVIPVEKALDPFGDAILAYEMNGETLPRDHGYPLRLLAPGHAGCRNVKWVGTISVTEKPSELDSGSRLDRHFAPDVNWESHKDHVSKDRCPEKMIALSEHYKADAGNNCAPVRVDQGPVIQTLPVQSIICTPANRITLSADTDTIPVSGVAWSGAGRGICRVEVSLDEGKTFKACELVKDENKRDAPNPEQGMGRNWAWTQFHLDAPVPAEVKEKLKKGEPVEISVYSKAIDGNDDNNDDHDCVVFKLTVMCVLYVAVLFLNLYIICLFFVNYLVRDGLLFLSAARRVVFCCLYAMLSSCVLHYIGDFNAQPQEMSHGWNVLGICVNHWSKVLIKLDPKLKKGDTVPPPATPSPGSPWWGDGTPNKP
jgi:DMSO/TMAO reductase YedYZ molybdopterin-dependent catalytic subunit